MKTNFSAAQLMFKLPGFSPSHRALTPHFRERGGAIYRSNSLMWKLNTQLVKADHMTTFELLMYGVCPDWLLCRMENPPRLASSECMRLPHTQIHSVVISVLADLLMLTCSACLLGSWCCILGLSLSLPHLCLIHSSYSFSPSFYLSVIWWVML